MGHYYFTQLPVYKKALEIFRISRAVSCCITDNKTVLELQNSSQKEDALANKILSESLLLAPQLAMINNSDSLYSRSRHIKKIRKAVVAILSGTQLQLGKAREQEVLMLLNSEIQQFERLFTEWLENLKYKRKGLE